MFSLCFLENQEVDLLLLDMLMEPGLSGYETYKKIKAFLPNQTESRDVKGAQELEAGTYLKKPYTLMEFGRAVRKEFAG